MVFIARWLFSFSFLIRYIGAFSNIGIVTAALYTLKQRKVSKGVTLILISVADGLIMLASLLKNKFETGYFTGIKRIASKEPILALFQNLGKALKQ